MGLALLLPILIALALWSGVRFTPVEIATGGTPAQAARLVALLALCSGLFALALWSILAPLLLRFQLEALLAPLANSPPDNPPLPLLFAQVEQLARTGGELAGIDESTPLHQAATRLRDFDASAPLLARTVATLTTLAGGALAFALMRLAYHPRRLAERVVAILLQLAAAAALAVTLGIVFSLVFETLRFFRAVPITEFLFGLRWEPQIPLREDQIAGAGAFGVVPVLLGTLLISLIAILVAAPLGLLSAIWLSEYAPPRARAIAKPILELLAGIPTVVYGFFAVIALAPAFRNAGATIGLDVAANSAIAAGFVMGVMILPLISSLSDDAFFAVPKSLREGAFALGATRLEMAVRVVLPAAFPGVISAFLLAISRALGETMIVLMAAGLIARLTINPLESVTTVTVQIVTLLTGDSEFDNPKTLSAFALGFLLLLLTLALNLTALRISQRWQRNYSES
ncbi:MAG: phosphate ABC transporter permease subunit PstC [Alphaproteobacteria bacterium]